MARPLPVEYLLVDIPASTPRTPIYNFTARDDRKNFPVENRLLDGQLQDFHSLSQYLAQWKPEEFLEAVSDFHLLCYLSRMDALPMRDSMSSLLEAIRNKDTELAFEWKNQEIWRTLESLITASSSSEG